MNERMNEQREKKKTAKPFLFFISSLSIDNWSAGNRMILKCKWEGEFLWSRIQVVSENAILRISSISTTSSGKHFNCVENISYGIQKMPYPKP